MGYLNLDEVVARSGQSSLPSGQKSMTVYHANSEVTARIFSDPNVTTTRPVPVLSDASGVFPTCHLQDGNYRVVLRDRKGAVLLDEDVVAVRTSFQTGPIAGFKTVTEMLASNSIAYAADDNGIQVFAGDIVSVVEGSYSYRVVDDASASYHLITAGGVKLDALPNSEHFFTPEQLGYSDEAANWGEIAQLVWDAGYILKGATREYLTSTTAYLRSDTGFIGTGGASTRVKAVDGFDGNIIDTENFDTMLANLEADESDGTLRGSILQGFTIDGNADNFGGTPSASNGWGFRVYGRQFRIIDIRVTQCAGPAGCTALPIDAIFDKGWTPYSGSKAGIIDELYFFDNRQENFVFRGPSDILIKSIYAGWPGNSQDDHWNSSADDKYSLIWPGERVHNVIFENAGAEVQFLHAFDNHFGFNLYTITNKVVPPLTDPARLRLRISDLIVERGWGNLYLDERVDYQLPQVYSHSNVFGSDEPPTASNHSDRPSIDIRSQLGGTMSMRYARFGDENGRSVIYVAGTHHNITVNADETIPGSGHIAELDCTHSQLKLIGTNLSGTAKDGRTSCGILFHSGSSELQVSALLQDCVNGFHFLPNSAARSQLDLTISETNGFVAADFINLDGVEYRTIQNARLVGVDGWKRSQPYISGGEISISAGRLAVTHSRHTISTQGNADTDDLETITPPAWASVGDRFLLALAKSSQTITLRAGVGNIFTLDDIVMDHGRDRLELEFTGAVFVPVLSMKNG